MITQLGKLEHVELRAHWNDEARDFTPWLASEEGLALLGKTIGRELELIGQERNVGPFRSDILARSVDPGEDGDHLVVIENQLGKTNHDHLGKIIVYAAGHNAKTVVWITETFTDQHRQAMDWLNNSAGERIAFFGLQIELFKIGTSPPAPAFKVVSSPNEWANAVKAEEPRAITDTKQNQLQFWEGFQQYAGSQKSPLQWGKPGPRNWYGLAIGRAGFLLSLTLNSIHKRIGCEIYMTGVHSKEAFRLLRSQKMQIESEVGQPLEWQLLEKKKATRIVLYKTGVIIDDSAQLEEAKEWLVQTAEKFHKAFSGRIKALEISDESEETAKDAV